MGLPPPLSLTAPRILDFGGLPRAGFGLLLGDRGGPSRKGPGPERTPRQEPESG